MLAEIGWNCLPYLYPGWTELTGIHKVYQRRKEFEDITLNLYYAGAIQCDGWPVPLIWFYVTTGQWYDAVKDMPGERLKEWKKYMYYISIKESLFFIIILLKDKKRQDKITFISLLPCRLSCGKTEGVGGRENLRQQRRCMMLEKWCQHQKRDNILISLFAIALSFFISTISYAYYIKHRKEHKMSGIRTKKGFIFHYVKLIEFLFYHNKNFSIVRDSHKHTQTEPCSVCIQMNQLSEELFPSYSSSSVEPAKMKTFSTPTPIFPLSPFK